MKKNNKAPNRLMKLFFSFFVYLFFSCGLDTIIYLEAPHFTHRANSLQESEQYIEFKTSDSINLAGYYLGFDILYKIYATEQELTSDTNKINSYNNSNPQASARWLLETKKYQRLVGKTEPIVKAGTTDRVVRVRLYDYGSPSTDKDKAGLSTDGIFVTVVKRKNGETFKVIPNGSDADDINKTSDKTEDYKFVAFFAVTVGLDEKFVALYSQILDLGYLELK
ncbi:MAG: hypothetical protein P1P64_09655 [Treponemataceae bacterium]